jgi:hypothetical protein
VLQAKVGQTSKADFYHMLGEPIEDLQLDKIFETSIVFKTLRLGRLKGIRGQE